MNFVFYNNNKRNVLYGSIKDKLTKNEHYITLFIKLIVKIALVFILDKQNSSFPKELRTIFMLIKQSFLIINTKL